MKNTFKKNIGRTFSIFLAIFLLLGTIPIVGVSAAEVTSNFEYTLLDDGTIEVTKYVSDNNSKVVIPEVIDGKTVTSVSKVCFNEFSGPADGFKNIESIFIPKTVNNLGEYEDIYTKDNCWTFSKLPNLKEIIVDNENQKYSSSEGILFDKNKETLLYYPRSKQANEYIVPNTVHYIKSVSFYQNVFLKKLKFSGKLYEVILDAVYTLEEVEYPVITNQPSDYVVRYCPSLKKIIVGKEVNFMPENEFSELSNVTLYVYNNSYALDWAKEHGFAYEIMEEPPIEKDLVDEGTGIKVKGTMDPDATLKVEKVESTVEDAVATYDITLRKDGDVIQPSGTITISIPSEIKDCKLFWVKDDGTKVEVNAIYENGNYVFTTDHLSVYALVKKPEPTTTEPVETTTAEPVTTVPVPTTTEPVETTIAEPVTTVPVPTTTEPVETTTVEPVTTVPVPTTTEPVETTTAEPVTTVPVPTTTEPVETTTVEPVTTVPVPTTTEPVETTTAEPVTTVESVTTVPITDPVTTVEPTTKSVATPDTPIDNNNSNSGSNSSSGSSTTNTNTSNGAVATGNMLGFDNNILIAIIIAATTALIAASKRRNSSK